MVRSRENRKEVEGLEATAAASLSKGRFVAALRSFDRLIELEPETARHRLRAADCLAKLGREPEAVDRYCQAARMYQAGGREPQALAVWRIALTIDPSNHDASIGMLAAEAAIASPRAAIHEPPHTWDDETPVGRVDAVVQSSRDAIADEMVRKQGSRGAPPDLLQILRQKVRMLEDERELARRDALDRALAADLSRACRFGLDLAVLVFEGVSRSPEIERVLRVSDFLADLPGGHIAVIALGASASGARRIADKVRLAVGPGGDVHAGIAVLSDRSEPVTSGQELLVIASAALERAIAGQHHAVVGTGATFIRALSAESA